MDKQNLDFFINESIQIDLNNFVISLICAATLSLLIQLFYIRFSSTLSNRTQFSKNFIILGVATCIVIMIVKSSIALSLGLVGALSIVRFRAAIKEPEELVYLFLIIATGLGCGAGQLKITVVGIFVALIIIFLHSIFMKKQNLKNIEILNLAIVIDQKISETNITKIIDDIKKISNEVNFVSMSRTKDTTNINLDIYPKKFESLVKITDSIKKVYKNSKIIIARGDNLSL